MRLKNGKRWKDGVIGQQIRLIECFLGIFLKKSPFGELRNPTMCPCKGLMEILLESISTQSEAAFSLSIAGIGAILFAWARLYQVIDSADMRGFRRPALLIMPFVFFVLSVLCRYLVLSLITGYNWELVTGHAQTNVVISDPVIHFISEYSQLLYVISSVQLGLSIVGLLLLSIWYIWNIFLGEKR